MIIASLSFLSSVLQCFYSLKKTDDTAHQTRYIAAMNHTPANPVDERTYAALSESLQYAVENYSRQPSTARMAQLAGMDYAQFQATFTNWVGVSPKRFVQSVTRKNALLHLQNGESSLATALALGLSSPSRLHDLMINTDGMTPAQVRQLGADTTVVWGVCHTTLGTTFAAFTEPKPGLKVLCKLLFGDESSLAELGRSAVQKDWPAALLVRNDLAAGGVASAAVHRNANLPLLVRGTGFQIHVWQALLAIPSGALVSYGAVAQALGKPKASRAVGTAVGDNPISVLIPCHRVIQRSGALGGYAWGLERKIVLLGQELAADNLSDETFSE